MLIIVYNMLLLFNIFDSSIFVILWYNNPKGLIKSGSWSKVSLPWGNDTSVYHFREEMIIRVTFFVCASAEAFLWRSALDFEIFFRLPDHVLQQSDRPNRFFFAFPKHLCFPIRTESSDVFAPLKAIFVSASHGIFGCSRPPPPHMIN